MWIFDGSEFRQVELPDSSYFPWDIAFDHDRNRWIVMRSDDGGVIKISGELDGIKEPEFSDEVNYICNIFPNPFNSTCTVNKPSKSIVKLFNTRGNHVKTLGWGENLIRADSDTPSGVYLAVFSDGNKVLKQQKITLIK